MKSGISRILSGYKNSLEHAKKVYEKEYNSRVKNAIEFYDNFLKNHLIDYSKIKNNPISQDRIYSNIKRWFSSTFNFVAIDGTCFKESLDPYLVFFSAAYAVRGNIKIGKENNPILYERWNIEQDKSVVAYLPIPFANLSYLFDEEGNNYDDEQKISYSTIHLDLMSLAEIYLAYTIASNESRPHMILLDKSISSSFNAEGIGRFQSKKPITIINKNINGFVIDEYDVRICYSHPYNKLLEIPSEKDFQLPHYLLRKLFENNYILSFEQLEELLKNLKKEINIEKLEKRIDNFIHNVANKPKLLIFDYKEKKLKLNVNYSKSWDKLRNFFNVICKSILEFKEDSEDIGMIYSYVNKNNEVKKAWFKPGDILFLKALGYRLLIEECWKHNILLVGIAKDSSTAYFSQFYFKILKNENCGKSYELYNFKYKKLPWTDRILLEAISLVKKEINAPWSTIEFDSAIMTLRKSYKDIVSKNNPIIVGAGITNSIYYQERLFFRSLGQFYIKRNKAIPSAGHVIFIDRLVLPDLEKNIERIYMGENNNIRLLIFRNNKSHNPIQEIIMIILDLLTKNLFPNVIGYPDPLHKADWGAKGIGNKVKPIILSSQNILKKNPLFLTLRQLRAQGEKE